VLTGGAVCVGVGVDVAPDVDVGDGPIVIFGAGAGEPASTAGERTGPGEMAMLAERGGTGVGTGVGAARAAPGAVMLTTRNPTATLSNRRMPSA